jgi:Type II secretion system (T2SS), protein M subtype b
MSLLRSTVSKIAALSLLVGGIGAIAFLAQRPYDQLIAQRADADTARQRLEIMQRTTAQQIDPALQTRIKQGFAEYYLPSAARGTLVATLQEQLRAFAATSQVNILQIAETQNAAATETSRDAIQLRLLVSGKPASLLQFFQLMQDATPWLHIDNISLRRALIASVDAQSEPPLEAEFDASSYVANAEPAP